MDTGLVFLAFSKLLPALLAPFGLVCLLLALAVLLPPRPRRQRALAGAALGLLMVGGCGPLARELGRSLEWQYLPSAEPQGADAIVLLGGATSPAIPPRARPELEDSGDRIVEAARLYREGRAPRIHVAGGRLDWTGTLGPEAFDIAVLLGQLGVPQEALVLDTESRSTYENAAVARRMLEPLGVHRILLVTSALHMPRSVGLFRHQGFEVLPAPTDFHIVELGPLGQSLGSYFNVLMMAIPNVDTLSYNTRVLREWLGIAVYRARGLID